VNIFLQGLNIAFSVVGANYLSKVITFGNEFKNVITISALFLIFFACASFSKYILSMITKTDLNNNFLILANKFLEVAFKKDGSFFKKVNKTHIYMNDTAIRSICEFYIVEVPKLVSSAVLCFICLLLISILKYEFLLFCLVISLVITIIGIIEFALQKRIIKKVMKNEVENIGVEYELANYVGTKQNYVIRDEISKKIKSNWHNHIKYDNTNSFYRNNIELVLTTIEKVISIAIVIFGYYFISNKEMDFAKLLFLFTLSNMY
jgi:ABC-type bacteriocin/lantibiotic exporter with double-glycine peptidase domain